MARLTIWLELSPKLSVEIDYEEGLRADRGWFVDLYKKHVSAPREKDAAAFADRQLMLRQMAKWAETP